MISLLLCKDRGWQLWPHTPHPPVLLLCEPVRLLHWEPSRPQVSSLAICNPQQANQAGPAWGKMDSPPVCPELPLKFQQIDVAVVFNYPFDSSLFHGVTHALQDTASQSTNKQPLSPSYPWGAAVTLQREMSQWLAPFPGWTDLRVSRPVSVSAEKQEQPLHLPVLG